VILLLLVVALDVNNLLIYNVKSSSPRCYKIYWFTVLKTYPYQSQIE